MNLKTWQVFVFSLIPLALVFAGVIGGSFHGADSEREVFPTPGPQRTPTPRSAAPVIVPLAPQQASIAGVTSHGVAVQARTAAGIANHSEQALLQAAAASLPTFVFAGAKTSSTA